MAEIEITFLESPSDLEITYAEAPIELEVTQVEQLSEVVVDQIGIEGPPGPAGPAGPTGTWLVNTAFKLKKLTLPIVAGAVQINMASANTFLILLTENITSISFTNLPPMDQSVRIQLYVQQDGVGNWTMSGWPAGVYPADNIPPEIDLSPNMRSGLTLDTFDGGTSVQLNFVGSYGPII